jgi:hypothetical protein
MQRRAAFIGLLTVVALLTGCSGGNEKPATLRSVSEEPPTAPTASPSTARAATHSSSTPRVVTAEQALATTRAYYGAVNRVIQEGGGYERYDAIVHSSCVPCADQGKRLRELTSNGQRVVGGTIEIVEEHIDQLAGNTALVRVAVRSIPGSVVDRKGETVETFPAGELSDRVFTVAATPEGVRVVHIVSLGER